MQATDIVFLVVGVGSFLLCLGLLAALDEGVLDRRR